MSEPAQPRVVAEWVMGKPRDARLAAFSESLRSVPRKIAHQTAAAPVLAFNAAFVSCCRAIAEARNEPMPWAA